MQSNIIEIESIKRKRQDIEDAISDYLFFQQDEEDDAIQKADRDLEYIKGLGGNEVDH